MEHLTNTMRRIRLHSIDSKGEIIALVLMVIVYVLLNAICKKLLPDLYGRVAQVIIALITAAVGIAAIFLIGV
ncbi:MAG: hypothetical protein IJ512_05870 [Ruminococcus sp.]|nr:hypothetical protein [Ruminococcus sp.]